MGPTPRSRRYAFFPKTNEPDPDSGSDVPDGEPRERAPTLQGNPWTGPSSSEDPGGELLTLQQAATLFGRSERTLRRWISSGLLTDTRLAGDRGPTRVLARELRARIAAAEELSTSESGDRAMIKVLEGRIADLRDQVADLREDRSRLLTERHELQEQLQRERAARAIVQRELANRPSFWDRLLGRV